MKISDLIWFYYKHGNDDNPPYPNKIVFFRLNSIVSDKSENKSDNGVKK